MSRKTRNGASPSRAIADRRPARSTARRSNDGESSRTCGLFRGVSRWPRIDDIFAASSAAILATCGITAWGGMGGCVRFDGRLGFGPVSSPALEIMADIASVHGGFHWTDDAGTTWAVRNGNENDRPGSAFAVTFRGAADVIDAEARDAAVPGLDSQLDAIQSKRPWNDDDRAEYIRLVQARNELRLVDGAEQILAQLGRRVQSDGSARLSAEHCVPGGNDRPGPDPAERPGGEWVAMLNATLGFEVAQLRLGTTGWSPQIEYRSAAVLEIEQCDARSYRLRVSSGLADAISRFGRQIRPGKHRFPPDVAVLLASTSAICVPT